MLAVLSPPAGGSLFLTAVQVSPESHVQDDTSVSTSDDPQVGSDQPAGHSGGEGSAVVAVLAAEIFATQHKLDLLGKLRKALLRMQVDSGEQILSRESVEDMLRRMTADSSEPTNERCGVSEGAQIDRETVKTRRPQDFRRVTSRSAGAKSREEVPAQHHLNQETNFDQSMVLRNQIALPLGRVSALTVFTVAGSVSSGAPRSRRRGRSNQASNRGDLDIITVVTKPHSPEQPHMLSMYNGWGGILRQHKFFQRGDVHLLASKLYGPEAFVVTGGRGGTVHLHSIRISINGRLIAGTRDDSSAARNKKQSGMDVRPNLNLVIDVGEQKEIFRAAAGGAALTGLAIKNYWRRVPVVVVTDAEGGVHYIQTNGTVLRSLHLAESYNQKMQHSGSNQRDEKGQLARSVSKFIGATNEGHPAAPLAVGVGATVQFVKPHARAISGRGMPPHVVDLCRGTRDSISSLAFDRKARNILFAGTRGGEVLMFAIWGGSSASQRGCRLVSKMVVDKNAAVKVHSTVGYLLAAAASGVTVAFNTSGVPRRHPRLVWRSQRPHVALLGVAGKDAPTVDSSAGSDFHAQRNTIPLPAFATTTGLPISWSLPGTTAIYVADSDDLQKPQIMSVYRTLLPYEEPRPNDTISWIRAPL